MQAIPMALRLAALFFVGLGVGVLVNLAVCRLRYYTVGAHPWVAPAKKAPARRWDDRIPVAGWLGMRRESAVAGRGFWIRPMLVELICGAGLTALYWWEIDQRGLLGGELPAGGRVDTWTSLVLHSQFIAHALLMAVMLAASLIDVDEKIIPDGLTVPGTAIGLVVAIVFPWSMLPALLGPGVGGQAVEIGFLSVGSPRAWPTMLDGWWGLVLGIGCFWAWCFALMPRTWYHRHGRGRAMALLVARLRRERSTLAWIVVGLIGAIVIALVWSFGPARWEGLFTALAGMAAGGGLVWVVRVVAGASLGREAMGFGDVTLMGMIGAFVGWQGSLAVFFLAPLAGILVGLLNLIFRRESEIPYGPFLCLAATGVIVRWADLWGWASVTLEAVFRLGLFMPIMFVFCFVLMACMLVLMRWIRSALFQRG